MLLGSRYHQLPQGTVTAVHGVSHRGDLFLGKPSSPFLVPPLVGADLADYVEGHSYGTLRNDQSRFSLRRARLVVAGSQQRDIRNFQWQRKRRSPPGRPVHPRSMCDAATALRVARVQPTLSIFIHVRRIRQHFTSSRSREKGAG